MRLSTIILLLFFAIIPTVSQASNFDQTVSRLQKTYQGISDWKADFAQDTYVELLRRKIKKDGGIFIKKPGKLRIEYKEEFGKQYISNGKKLWVYTPGDSQVELYSKISKLVAKEALAFMKGLGDLKKDFHLQPLPVKEAKGAMIQNKKLILIKLIPRDPHSVIDTIVIGLNPKNSLVYETTIYNASGNVTHYVFKNIELNSNLSDDLFDFKKPKGVKVIRGG